LKENLSNLVRDSKLEKLALSLKTPNFFNILKISQNEIRHSNFLAWLLTPNESHNLGSLFLKWFLKEVFSSDLIKWANEFTIDSINLINVQVLREWKHIDIVLVHEDFVIAIENKVKSNEHSNQLKRYLDKINDNFPDKDKGFVYLTLEGLTPQSEEDQNEYVPIGYDVIKSRIEIVLDVYKESLSDKVKNYIEDYLLILNREIMKEDESIELARELYKNHKEAIDFIIENRPDRIAEIREIIESRIEEHGYVLQTCNKYYARFLTERLVDIIPRTGVSGWRGNESFLFEMSYWEKSISLKFVISPGNEHNKQILAKVVKSLPNSKNASGKLWLTYYSDPFRVNLLNEKFEDDAEVEKLIDKILNRNKDVIEQFESEILKVKHEFE
jgi:hypothetical protein